MDTKLNINPEVCGDDRAPAKPLATLLVAIASLLVISYGEARFIEQAPAWSDSTVEVCGTTAPPSSVVGRNDVGIPVAGLH